jgi:hypothetical protein
MRSELSIGPSSPSSSSFDKELPPSLDCMNLFNHGPEMMYHTPPSTILLSIFALNTKLNISSAEGLGAEVIEVAAVEGAAISDEPASTSDISTETSLLTSGVSSSIGSAVSSRLWGTGVLFGASSDFSRLAGDWDRAMVSVDDDVCAEGWRRIAGDSAGADDSQAAASLESVSISVVEDEEGLDCGCVVSCTSS